MEKLKSVYRRRLPLPNSLDPGHDVAVKFGSKPKHKVHEIRFG